jgi:hypothetical protein
VSDCGCLPDAKVLKTLAARARNGGGAALPYVGDGSPGTAVGCAHGSWRLGDLTDPAPETPTACTEQTKAGNPCQGTPGPDGLCAAHKSKGEDGAEDGDGDGS